MDKIVLLIINQELSTAQLRQAVSLEVLEIGRIATTEDALLLVERAIAMNDLQQLVAVYETPKALQ